MKQQAIEQFIADMEKIWCFPEAAMEALSLIDDQNVDVAKVAMVLAKDQWLAGRVLQIANSPFYGLSGKIGSIKEACVVVGLNSLRCVVLAAGLAGTIADNQQSRKDKNSLWAHAIRTAAVSKLIAEKVNLDEEMAFTMGLLHDIGESVITLVSPETRDQIDEVMEESRCSLLEAEEMVLGFNHGELGGEIARRWRLPDEVVHVIALHHAPMRDGFSPYPCLIYLANSMCSGLVGGMKNSHGLDELSNSILQSFSMKQDEMDNLHDEAMRAMEMALESFGGI